MAPSFTIAAAILGLATIASAGYEPTRKNNVVIYWGAGSDQLDLIETCKNENVDVVNIAFINKFPDDAPGGYPGSDFGNQCWTNTYNNSQGVPTALKSRCDRIGPQIKQCQDIYKKTIMLSLGGDGSYYIKNTASAYNFADFMWKSFGPVPTGDQAGWSVRPFGDAVVDGFDLDIEAWYPEDSLPKGADGKDLTNYRSNGYADFNNRMRSNFDRLPAPKKTFYMSGAPQCKYTDLWLGDAISNSKFDWLFVQFYNTPGCSARDAVKKIQDNNYPYDYSLQTWDHAQTVWNDMKIIMGIPAAPKAANTGFYLEQYEAAQVIERIRRATSGYDNFAGVGLWESTYSQKNLLCDKDYSYYIKSFLTGLPKSSSLVPREEKDCPPIILPPVTSSTSSSKPVTTSSVAPSTSSSIVTTSTSTSTKAGPVTTTVASTTTTTSSSAVISSTSTSTKAGFKTTIRTTATTATSSSANTTSISTTAGFNTTTISVTTTSVSSSAASSSSTSITSNTIQTTPATSSSTVLSSYAVSSSSATTLSSMPAAYPSSSAATTGGSSTTTTITTKISSASSQVPQSTGPSGSASSSQFRSTTLCTKTKSASSNAVQISATSSVRTSSAVRTSVSSACSKTRRASSKSKSKTITQSTPASGTPPAYPETSSLPVYPDSPSAGPSSVSPSSSSTTCTEAIKSKSTTIVTSTPAAYYSSETTLPSKSNTVPAPYYGVETTTSAQPSSVIPPYYGGETSVVVVSSTAIPPQYEVTTAVPAKSSTAAVVSSQPPYYGVESSAVVKSSALVIVNSLPPYYAASSATISVVTSTTQGPPYYGGQSSVAADTSTVVTVKSPPGYENVTPSSATTAPVYGATTSLAAKPSTSVYPEQSYAGESKPSAPAGNKETPATSLPVTHAGPALSTVYVIPVGSTTKPVSWTPSPSSTSTTSIPAQYTGAASKPVVGMSLLATIFGALFFL